jgi:hypothetical protein
MRRPATALLVLLAPLAGCATAEGFDARMASLIGMGEAELVRAIGVPDADFQTADGRRFLQYERLGVRGPAQVQPVFGMGFGGWGWRGRHGWGTGVGIAGPAYVYPPPACSVTFEMVAGRVAGFTRRGDGCRAVPA